MFFVTSITLFSYIAAFRLLLHIFGKEHVLFCFNTCSFVINFYLSLVAIYMTYHFKEPQLFVEEYPLTEYERFMVLSFNTIGPSITAYSLFTMYGTILWGTDKTIDAIIHHMLFVIICCCCMHYRIHITLSIIAVCMEISTPALIVMTTTRRNKKYLMLNKISSFIFATLFFLFRIVFFTYHLFYHMYFFGLYLKYDWLIQMIHVIYFFVWCLQIYWFQFIIAKCKRLIK